MGRLVKTRRVLLGRNGGEQSPPDLCALHIGDNIVITVMQLSSSNQVVLSIEAPREIEIKGGEEMGGYAPDFLVKGNPPNKE